MSSYLSASAEQSNAVAVLRVCEVRPDVTVFALPGTEYRLHLATSHDMRGREGKRVAGEIHANALRMHRSDTGGRFIEPIYGSPRIVQGEVIDVDAQSRRVLMDMAVPVWVTVMLSQDPAAFQRGELWNCYVESGTRFESRE